MMFQKHRMGLKGHQVAVMRNDDDTVKSHSGAPSNESVATVQIGCGLLHRNLKKSYTVQGLAENNLISGKEAVKKALQRPQRLGEVQKLA